MKNVDRFIKVRVLADRNNPIILLILIIHCDKYDYKLCL